MNTLKIMGNKIPSMHYEDRRTVKVLIKKGAAILILGDGLLPGGGVEQGETDVQAVLRELAEEIGASVTNLKTIGEVIQYRDFLGKRYVIIGYTADISAFSGHVSPQDDGEAVFTHQWLSKNEAVYLVKNSLKKYSDMRVQNDSQQGKIYNLKTTLEFLSAIES